MSTLNGFYLKRNSSEIVFLFFFIIFNFLGPFEYFFYSRYYISPSGRALELVFFSNVFLVLGWVGWLCVGRVGFFKYNKFSSLSELKPAFPINLLLYLSFSFFAIYTFVHRDNFLFYSFLAGAGVAESSRPDVSGALPRFYTFSVVCTSILMPLLIGKVMYYRKKGLRAVSLLFFMALLIVAFSLGNKSTLVLVVMYLMFHGVGFRRFRLVILRKAILFGGVFFAIYFSYKFMYAGYSSGEFFNVVESVYRRVVVINTSVMGVLFDNFVIVSGGIPQGFNHLKQYLFYLVYGYSSGGAPVPFHAEFVYLLGIGPLAILLVPFYVFFVFFLRSILFRFVPVKAYYACSFLSFYGAFILATATLQDFLIRSLIPIFLLSIVSRLKVAIRSVGSGSRVNAVANNACHL